MSDDASTIDLKSGKFPVLTSSNFTEWLDLAQTVLISRGLWEYATGEITEGSAAEDKKSFRREDAKAVAFLKLAAGREQRAHLLGLTSSKEVLEKLKSVHQVSQLERVQALLSEFHTFKIQSGESIDISASKLTQLQLQIAAADQTERPSDSIKKTVLLHGLPDEYQSAVFALKAAGLARITFDDMVQRLREVETAMSGPLESSQDQARYTGRRNTKNPRNIRNDQRHQKSRADIECYHCHRKGHMKRDCRDLYRQTDRGESQSRAPRIGTHESVWRASYQGMIACQIGYGKPDQQQWILDSGCTKHMTFDEGHFIDFKRHGGTVTVANGKTLQVRGGGTIEVPIQGKMTQITGVIYVPDLGYNLLSVSQLGERGMKCNFDSSSATLLRNGKVVAIARKLGRTYVLKGSADERVSLASDNKGQEVSERWHQRLGHPGLHKTELFGSGAVDGVPPLQQVSCEICKITKSTQKINRAPAARVTQRLERVYMDFWGPYEMPTIGGSRYMLTITDDFSRKSWIYLTKDRREVYQVFKSWRTQAQLESGQKLKAIRSDNAPEFIKLSKELEKDGIRIEFTVPHTPSQNGVAERLNRTLITKARAMLVAAELPSQLWGEAVHVACYLKNLTPIDTEAELKSPEELWTGRPTDLGHLRTFGCVAFVHIPTAKRGKLDKTSFKGVFVGYSQTARQYRILDPSDMTIKRCSSVEFDELQKGGPLLKRDKQDRREYDSEIPLDLEVASTTARDTRESSRVQETTEELAEPDEDDDASSNIDVYQPPAPEAVEEADEEPREPPRAIEGRPQRSRRMPQRYENTVAFKVNYSPTEEPVTPTSFEEAVHGRESRKWKLAIEDQLRSLEANHTWEVVDKPKDVNLISTK
jgi:hypothetical protein